MYTCSKKALNSFNSKKSKIHSIKEAEFKYDNVVIFIQKVSDTTTTLNLLFHVREISI